MALGSELSVVLPDGSLGPSEVSLVPSSVVVSGSVGFVVAVASVVPLVSEPSVEPLVPPPVGCIVISGKPVCFSVVPGASGSVGFGVVPIPPGVPLVSKPPSGVLPGTGFDGFVDSVVVVSPSGFPEVPPVVPDGSPGFSVVVVVGVHSNLQVRVVVLLATRALIM